MLLRRFSLGRLVAIFVAIAFAAVAHSGPALAQSASVDWGNLGLADQAAVPATSNVTATDGTVATVTWSATNNNANGTFVPAYAAYVVYGATQLGGSSKNLLGNFDNASFDTGDKITTTITLSRAVSSFAFRVTDIDKGSWTDAVEVAYDTGNGTFVNAASFATIVGNAARTNNTAVNGWIGTASAAATSTTGDITFNFGTTAVKRIRVTYFSYTGSGDPGGQVMGISGLTFAAATADLSLAKTLLTAAPFSGGSVTWRLALTNSSASAGTPSSVTVKDTLPTGFTFTGSSGSGTFSSSTGVWTVANLAPGQTVTLDLTGTLTASAGTAVNNRAEVASSSLADPDSTPNNGVTTEDDYAAVSFTTASGSRFVCDARLFASQSNLTQLVAASVAASPLTATNFGTATRYYNALGYNPADNFMYALDSNAATSNRLLRISGDGAVAELGSVSGLPTLASGSYNAGAFIGNDTLLVRAGSTASNFYLVNVSTMTATMLAQPAGFTSDVGDLAFSPVTGKVYGVGSGILYEFTVGASTVAKRDIGSVGVAGQFGAVFSDSLGNIYGANTAGGLYGFDLATGAAILVASTSALTDLDGANCYSATITTPADPRISKTDGTAFYQAGAVQTYTIVVGNTGPYGITRVSVSDPLPTNVPAANVKFTAVAAGGATTTITAETTGALSDTVNLPVNGTVTYTVKLTVPANYTDALVNTATIVTGGNVADSNTANNFATDTDTAKAQLTLAKTSSLVSDPVNGASNPKLIPGAIVDYFITVTNSGNGAVDADTTLVIDAMPAKVSFLNGDANGSAAGADAVNFSSTASGLTFAYVSDVRFSNAASAPADFAACTYTPTAGFDANVRYVCFNPKGTFAGASGGTPASFTLQFRARVN